MTINKQIYKPREDSNLLENYVKKYATGNVLDIGTGSGIQALAASRLNSVRNITATDINETTIKYCEKNIKNKKIKFLVSDLFDNLKDNKKFDTIIFNPPYLPNELKIKDLTLEGGKKGYEVIEKFLNEVNKFLKPNGKILITFSSLTKKEKIDEFIQNNLLEFKLLDKKHIFFEDLYIYLIEKSPILIKLEKRNIKNIKYYSKGKRGYIFVGTYNNKKVAIKMKNPGSKAISRIDNEINFLKLLNKKNIGPKLLFYDEDYFVYKFIKGIKILDFLISLNKNSINKKIILNIIKNIYNQLYIMDKLKINKEEMSHPHKHILINNKNKPILIDFERCHHILKPSNVTQFCDFLISNSVKLILKCNDININNKKLINLAKVYKKQQNKENFNKIIKYVKNEKNT